MMLLGVEGAREMAMTIHMADLTLAITEAAAKGLFSIEAAIDKEPQGPRKIIELQNRGFTVLQCGSGQKFNPNCFTTGNLQTVRVVISWDWH